MLSARLFSLRYHVGLVLFVAVFAGCVGPQPIARSMLTTLPKSEAIRIVNSNSAKVSATLRAVGSVDGSATDPNGRSRSFHLEGVLFYLAPRNLRFDLKSFGERQLLLGSNADGYWFFSAEDKRFRCGETVEELDLPSEIPVAPDQMIEALGLSGIPRSSGLAGPVQRVDGEYQQLIFVSAAAGETAVLEKEYWLERSAPRMIRRVLFRQPDGDVWMNSRLDDYRPLDEGGPLLPHSMTAEWPVEGTTLRFRISKWSLHPQISPDGPQFATPAECDANRG